MPQKQSMHGTSVLRLSLSRRANGACHACRKYRSASIGAVLGWFAREACGSVSASSRCSGAGRSTQPVGDCTRIALGHRLPPSDQERLLFISAMYRPEWRATAATGPLTVRPVANAFLGVTIPAGITDVTVEFTPTVQIALTWFSSLVLFGSTVGVLLVRRRRGDRVTRPVKANVA